MIFVTVGTTHFDGLVRKVDELRKLDCLRTEAVCQIGSGSYEPEACEFFRFRPSIESWIDEADLVICHGGATVMSLLHKKKRFVALANTELAGDHQTKFLTRLAQSVNFPWGRDVDDLSVLIEAAFNSPPPSITMPHLADEIRGQI